jgi:uncharacterized protein (TIGR02611 family)
MSNGTKDNRSFLARYGKRIIVIVAGSALLLAGVTMLVLPGPGFLVIAAGLAILASEFDWAERWMHRVRRRAEAAAESAGTSLRAVVIVGIVLTIAASVAAWFLFR